jgi:hypothetical protein
MRKILHWAIGVLNTCPHAYTSLGLYRLYLFDSGSLEWAFIFGGAA